MHQDQTWLSLGCLGWEALGLFNSSPLCLPTEDEDLDDDDDDDDDDESVRMKGDS